MISVEVNADKLAQELKALGGRVELGVALGLRAAAEKVADIERDEIAKIEERPIPYSNSGRPLWERTGDLKDGVTDAYPAKNQAVVYIEGPAAAYAARREGLGVDWHPKNPADGVERVNQFAHDAAEQAPQAAQDAFAEAFKDTMGL